MKKRRRLGEMLLEDGLLSAQQLTEALEEQKRLKVRLGQIVVQRGWVLEQQVINLLSRQLRLEEYSPEAFPLDPAVVVGIIPPEMALRWQCVPLKRKGRLLTVAMTDPTDIESLSAIEMLTDYEVEPVLCNERTLNQLYSTVYGVHTRLGELVDTIEEMETETSVTSEPYSEDLQIGSLMDMIQEAPVVSLVNSILAHAVRDGASDVHISPEQSSISIRFRIDGKLHEAPAPPKSMLMPIVSRVKILAGMDIATLRTPQDGRFTVRLGNRQINVRAATLPTIHGENLVLRLLDMGPSHHTLGGLGMSDRDREKLENAIRRPYGMILSTGPTGSGKSTSLYAILREINQPDTNIITLEDPVEYRVERIRQVQLNRKAGMSFASGLRSILRQDPDVIMVGEIRDSETANIAVQASLTGHRLLSTLHTNDAASAIIRLIDMGIESFLVSSVLLVSFAQRLVRTVCPFCKEPYRPSEASLERFGILNAKNEQFMRGRGCLNCMSSGFKGRTAIFEVLLNDEMVQDMINRKHSAQEITRAARSAGNLRTLRDDAADKVLRGITTIEEAASAITN